MATPGWSLDDFRLSTTRSFRPGNGPEILDRVAEQLGSHSRSKRTHSRRSLSATAEDLSSGVNAARELQGETLDFPHREEDAGALLPCRGPATQLLEVRPGSTAASFLGCCRVRRPCWKCRKTIRLSAARVAEGSDNTSMGAARARFRWAGRQADVVDEDGDGVKPSLGVCFGRRRLRRVGESSSDAPLDSPACPAESRLAPAGSGGENTAISTGLSVLEQE